MTHDKLKIRLDICETDDILLSKSIGDKHMKFIRFPSIEQYRRIVKEITFASAYVGQDKDDKPIYDMTKEKPTIEFQGTVKLHGTNAGVGYDGENIWAQKRGSICTVDKDNVGFAAFVESKKEIFREFFDKFNLSPGVSMVIFGEWCGGNIQKGVGITDLDKMFVIFDARLVIGDDEKSWFLGHYIKCMVDEIAGKENSIYHILNFPTYKLSVDFNKPELVQEELIRITEEVEKECPVAKQFGVAGVGEGVVWCGYWYAGSHDERQIYRFKVKGQKHSTSKVKQLAAVDVEEITQCRDFVEYAVTPNRLNQAIEQVFTSIGLEPDKRWTGDFIRWIINDIAKEETDTLVESKLDPKYVSKYIGEAARLWFFKYLGP